MLAAALLTVISFPILFGGTVVGFLASAALVLTVTLPSPRPAAKRGVWDRTTRGIRIYLATPRLRGLLALNLAVAAAGAMVIVNAVVIVQARLGLGETEVALALAAFGGGSMVAALVLPRLLDRMRDRPAMIAGAMLLVVGTALGPLVGSFATLVPLWLLIGFGYSLTQTPTGRLLRRSAQPEDRPAIFAAQFALSHACWLITYPLAGRFGAGIGIDATFLLMAGIAALGVAMAWRLWPAEEPETVPHVHPDLPEGHPHLRDHTGPEHRHPLVIDDLHRHWPYPARPTV